MAEKYFLGAMTQYGFSTEFGKLVDDTDYYTFILKGGAGTGKSSLMKKLADYFEEYEDVVRYYCSSDPNSLDAVVLKGSKCIVCDGTAPHTFDPKYPGACQKIINLGEHWNEKMLIEKKLEIIDVTDKNKSMLSRAKRFATALSNVCFDTYFCGLSCLDNEKFDSFIERFTKRILDKKGNGNGTVSVKQLSVLTENGCMTWTETLDNYLDIYYMKDEYYACSAMLVKAVSKEASRRGYDVIECPSVAFSNSIYEHLLIPELGVALVSASPLTKLSDEGQKTINMARFYDKKQYAKLKARLKLNKIAAANLYDEVSKTMKNAKVIHDEIEKNYISAMNFDELNQAYEMIKADIMAKRN